MASRFAASLFVVALLVTLFAPAVAAGADGPTGDGTTATGADADGHVLDRLRSTVAAPAPARSGVRDFGNPMKRSGRAAGDAEVLEQPTRAAVYRAIHESPGVTLTDLAEDVGVARSTVRYHARLLREAGLVDATEVSGALRYAPADADAELAAVLNADGTGEVLDAVAEHEPASVTTLARATDRAPSTVHHHLSALEERGLVERERVGEAVVTSLAPATRSAMHGRRGAAPADD